MTTVVAITIQSLMVRPSPASSAATLTLPTKRRLLDLGPSGFHLSPSRLQGDGGGGST